MLGHNARDPAHASSWHGLYLMYRKRAFKEDGSCCVAPKPPTFYGPVDDDTVTQVTDRMAEHVKRRTNAIASGDNTDAFINDPFMHKNNTAGGFNGQTFLSPNVQVTAATYNAIDAGRVKEIGPHAMWIKPVKFTMLMEGYMLVTVDGRYTSVDGKKDLKTLQIDYLLVDMGRQAGTDGKHDWQAMGLLGESIAHTVELSNKGAAKLAEGLEAAYVLNADEFVGHFTKGQTASAAEALIRNDVPMHLDGQTGVYSRTNYAATLDAQFAALKVDGFTSVSADNLNIVGAAGDAVVETQSWTFKDAAGKALRVEDRWALKSYGSNGAEAGSWHALFLASQSRARKQDGSCCESGVTFGASATDADKKAITAALELYVTQRNVDLSKSGNGKKAAKAFFADGGASIAADGAEYTGKIQTGAHCLSARFI